MLFCGVHVYEMVARESSSEPTFHFFTPGGQSPIVTSPLKQRNGLLSSWVCRELAKIITFYPPFTGFPLKETFDYFGTIVRVLKYKCSSVTESSMNNRTISDEPLRRRKTTVLFNILSSI